ncbi:MAG: Xaa-Pro aminopeptidase [Hydrogenophilales bacterium CG03_land_8_20_14_0_80_62_28]|nr:MAG: Xaa-Pro aminopeptidase [Hydrogenophilaceae bacterium CG1_02_62_390]PIV22521.1 MAG: Xaa-Pro aminopeptidase [Hydrogenophilales bacterium CG03_land_8_20_14_0_80_62_28]PIW38317.1 MAG: Xaa-Pro aminopeptidase [Hydrogenophilales bacterium CG15_BIG_FIL_POST_REV_8_21_14_020_62_31]PIW72186.1 MAG: Xaa-Pro aminopeptidase [Hydrogenophilales bacterium CG12_big_fil_rev_8_21_14_0_65_61_21]PIX02335.1 MAG: Xaa-Pro aminopeptidase [Hydrogenophilales bacterium CG_4_8_14_3_um_filter_62_83]PIY99420.1 MAG: Xa
MDLSPPDRELYRQRRRRVMQAMGEGVMVIATAPEAVRNRDAYYPFRPDSYFWWLTGFAEPEAVVVLVAGKRPRQYLFCREKNIDKEVWDGFRWGPKEAKTAFGFDVAWPIEQLDKRLPLLLENQPVLSYLVGHDTAWDNRVMGWLNAARDKARTGVQAPAALTDARRRLDEFRLFKDDHELAMLRRAAAISADAHRRAMRACRPGVNEHEIEAELLYAFRRGGAEAPAYTSIVAGGANACILHYVFNNRPLKDGDLLLIDAGAEYAGYAADITRTFPVNGRFSPAQKDTYEIVLAAQAAAIAEVKPGNAWNAAHEAAVRVLAQGMKDLKLLKGRLDGLIESGAYRRFYLHRTGHWLGLDVHDAGEYKVDGAWRALQPGMVLTVEPGLYIRPGEGVPRRLENIGIRIEDDVLVTKTGCEVLSAATPKTVAEIESAMSSGRRR